MGAGALTWRKYFFLSMEPLITHQGCGYQRQLRIAAEATDPAPGGSVGSLSQDLRTQVWGSSVGFFSGRQQAKAVREPENFSVPGFSSDGIC